MPAAAAHGHIRTLH